MQEKLYGIEFTESEIGLLEKFLPIVEDGLKEHLQERKMLMEFATTISTMVLGMDETPAKMKADAQEVKDLAASKTESLSEDKAELEGWTAICNRLLPSRETAHEPQTLLD